MKFILGFMKKYRLESVLAPLFKMLEAGFELFVPLVIKNIIDVGIAGGNRRDIVSRVLILLLLAFVGLLAAISAQYFAARAAVSVASDLRQALFSHISALSYKELDGIGTPTLITRLTSDVNSVQNGVNLTLRLLLRSPFVVFGAVIMAFTVDTNTALIFTATVPVLAAVIFAVMLISTPLYKKVQARLDKVVTSVRENLSGVRVLRAFGKEAEEKKIFAEKADALFRDSYFAGKVSSLLNPVTYVLINTAIILLIYAGAFRVNTGGITRGAVVAQYNYMSQILVELVKLANLVISISRALASAKRIETVFEEKSSLLYPDEGEVPDFTAPAVEFRSVSLRYSGSAEEALGDLSFTIRPGEKIGIIGATGAGKTSLIQLIPRFYDATGGQVLLFGNDVRKYSEQTLSDLVSVVPQKAVLFSGSIRENLLWGRKDAAEEEIYEALRVSQALNFVQREKDGLEEEIEQGGRNLSGGQRQRLTIARALLKKAPILILDDSAAALDAETARKLTESLSDLRNAPAVITVSQRTGAVSHCDKIFVLEDGRLTDCGAHEELLKNSSTYRFIYDCETGAREE